MIQVDVVGIAADTQKTWLKTLTLSENATVADALRAAGLPPDAETALFNEAAVASHPLKHHDRIDVLSPLSIDPKEARRLRACAKEPHSPSNRGRHGGNHRLFVAT